MKISFFENSFATWIDYSNIEECKIVLDLETEQIEKLNNWCDYKIIDWNLEIIETDFYLNKIKDEKISEIKQKYQDIIFAKYSLTDQLNMWNEATYIVSMVAFEKRDFTELEAVRLNEIKQAKLWIDEQRQACADEISLI